MQQEIEKLKQEKNKLTNEYENSRTEYRTCLQLSQSS